MLVVMIVVMIVVMMVMVSIISFQAKKLTELPGIPIGV